MPHNERRESSVISGGTAKKEAAKSWPHNRRDKSGKSDLPRKEDKANLLGWEAGWNSEKSKGELDTLFYFNYCYSFIISRFCFIFIDACLSKLLSSGSPYYFIVTIILTFIIAQ